ncbi:MAG: class II aldolase/adducin family protein [Kiritimatiellaeota bacterium]|nr:class II aldolase/adducin family protein [Kiritimatiellota bacterium]
MRYQQERFEVARFMRRLYRQGLTTTSGGNISLRLDDGHILLTASQHDKGRLRAEDVGVLDMDGRNLTPTLRPSIEIGMHLAVYRARSDAKAVVHAHPPFTSAFCASTERISTHLVAESYAILGDPAYVPYLPMGSRALAEAVATRAHSSVCILMANHGALTLGTTLLEAFDRIEVLEAAARLTLYARLLGAPRALNAAELTELDEMLGRPRPV